MLTTHPPDPETRSIPPLREPQAFDLGAFRQICALRPAARTRIFGLYLRDAATVAGAIEASAHRGDTGSMRDAAHRLKSSSAQVGARRLADVSARLERAGRAADLTGVPALLAALFAELDVVTRSLSPLVERQA